MFIHTFCLYMGGVERVKQETRGFMVDPANHRVEG